MKGIIFNLLEMVVSAEHGEDVWDEALEAAGVEGVYTAVGTYPNEELGALVTALATKLGISADDAVRWFGRTSVPLLADRYGGFFEPHTSTRAFLLTLNDVIHPEVRKLFPGAYAPEFEFELLGKDGLALGYRSHRDLCSFAEGLVEGAAAHYGETVTVEHTSCTRRGDDHCVLQCTFSSR